MNVPFLKGNNIYLRGLKLSDVDGNYIRWFNDAEICAGNSHHIFPLTREAGETFIREAANSRDSLVLAIALLENDDHIGNISLQKIDYHNRCAELAIIIGEKSCWGKGLAHEASLLVLRHGFTEMNLHRVYCGTSSNNVAMQRLAASLGMAEEGRRRESLFKHGKYLDIIEYGLVEREFIVKFGIDPTIRNKE